MEAEKGEVEEEQGVRNLAWNLDLNSSGPQTPELLWELTRLPNHSKPLYHKIPNILLRLF